MDIKKWIPWNWFKKEEEGGGSTVPVRRQDPEATGWGIESPFQQFHREMDRLLNRSFGSFDRAFVPQLSEAMIKPSLDLGATDAVYTVKVEIPGVDEKDVKLEIVNDTLTIRGEKKHEAEDKGKNYYRIERSYGSFQRVLSLPDDVDQDGIKATFKKGVLTVTAPRKALPASDVREIPVIAA